MKNKRWDVLVYCVIFTVMGAVGGWIASRQSSGSQPTGSHSGSDGHATQRGVELPPETLSNLGVTVGTLQPSSFSRYRSVPAVVAHTPSNEQPLVAPIGGRVREILVEPGMLVRAGDLVVTLVRDPIPRPTLSHTEEILKPGREAVHQMVVELHKAGEEKKIVQTELDRISKYTNKVGDDDLPILPRQTVIDLQYQVLRAQFAVKRARLELEKHGFTMEQIDAIANGGPIPQLGQEMWRRALEHNGLWTNAARELHAVIPANLHNERWTIATIGELAAAGLVREPLIEWLKAIPETCDHFLEIGALLQRGYSVEDLRELHAVHALDPIVELRAPGAGRVQDWDVVRIEVKPGERVSVGDHLVKLLDPRQMYLKTRSLGGEQADILRAISTQGVCEAHPLIQGSGPVLRDIKIGFLTSDTTAGGTVAYAKVQNSALNVDGEHAGQTLRSWKLRAGLKYMLRVPIDTMENVFVVPSEAVAREGPHRVVFIPDGSSFRSIRVAVAYQDEEVSVIPVDSRTQLFPGDSIALSGAYALSIALQQRDPHADAHGHAH